MIFDLFEKESKDNVPSYENSDLSLGTTAQSIGGNSLAEGLHKISENLFKMTEVMESFKQTEEKLFNEMNKLSQNILVVLNNHNQDRAFILRENLRALYREIGEKVIQIGGFNYLVQYVDNPLKEPLKKTTERISRLWKI